VFSANRRTVLLTCDGTALRSRLIGTYFPERRFWAKGPYTARGATKLEDIGVIASVNLIVTGRENSSIEVEELRKRGCSVEIIPPSRLLDLLKLEVSPFTVADAVVCFIEANQPELLTSPPTLGLQTYEGEKLAREIRQLPDSCAMTDGRKWKAIPIVIVLQGIESLLLRERIGRLAVEENVAFVEALPDFPPTFRAIDGAVRNYRQRVLAEFSNLGFLVSYENGRYRVGPAMNATGDIEGYFYDRRRDKRGLRDRYFTVDRDQQGIQFEVELFEALINRQHASEEDFQSFFEDNPHFLADARMSQPMPHVRLKNAQGEVLIPDFVVKPIVASQRDSNWEVLELKTPSAQILAGPRRHLRLSHEVHQAIAQLRDYGDYFKNPENKQRVSAALGHALRFPRLAVLIGRLRDGQAEDLEKAQSREADIRIVTYDEILQRQQFLVR